MSPLKLVSALRTSVRVSPLILVSALRASVRVSPLILVCTAYVCPCVSSDTRLCTAYVCPQVKTALRALFSVRCPRHMTHPRSAKHKQDYEAVTADRETEPFCGTASAKNWPVLYARTYGDGGIELYYNPQVQQLA